jgi:hypothetical protein
VGRAERAAACRSPFPPSDGYRSLRGGYRLSGRKRTRWLEGEGYRVLRFWNSDVTSNQNGVLEMISAAVYGSIEAHPLKHEGARR